MNDSIFGLFAFMAAVVQAWRRDHPLRRHDVRQVILRQIFFTGLQAFRLVAFGAVIFGFVTVAQSGAHLQRIGGGDAIGPILVAAFVRELGPLVTVIVVIARSVSAMASELSSMKAQSEIDSLRAVGVSPLSYLVLPRILAGSIATLLLAMHFVWIAFGAGFIVAQLYVNMPWDRYLQSILENLSVIDLGIFFFKTFSLSLVTFSVACYCGLRTSGASFEVPQATTRAVVWSFSFCFVAQVCVSLLYYFFMFKDSALGGLL